MSSEHDSFNDPFEDHLHDNLHHQGAGISVRPEGVDAVAGRYEKRRRRGVVARVAVAAIMLAGVGGFIATREDNTATTQAAGEGDVGEDVGADPGVNGDGPRLVLTNIESAASPRPDLWGGGEASGVYYFLSTAPAVETAGLEATDGEDAYDMYMPNTLYAYDGSDWTSNSFDDRYVSDLGADGGVLYAVSTGLRGDSTPQDQVTGLALGRSTDTGESWTWTDVDLTQVFGENRDEWPPYVSPRVTVKDGTYVIVVNIGAGQLWDDGWRLANENGLEINPGDDEVVNVDTDGISFVRDAYAPNPDTCAGKRELYRQQLEDEAGISELEDFWMSIEMEGREPTEAEMAEMNALEQKYSDFWQESEAKTADYMETVEGCEKAAQCLRIQIDQQQRMDEIQDKVRAEVGLPPESEMLTEEDYMKYEDLYDEYYQKMDVYYQEFEQDFAEQEMQSCDEALYGNSEEGDGPPWDESDVETVLWADLGVTLPDSWKLTNHAFMIEGDTVTSLGPIYEGRANYIESFEVVDGSFELRVDQTNYQASYNEAPEMKVGVYRSTDGREWAASTENVSEEYYGPSSATFKNMSFRVTWEDEEEGWPEDRAEDVYETSTTIGPVEEAEPGDDGSTTTGPPTTAGDPLATIVTEVGPNGETTVVFVETATETSPASTTTAMPDMEMVDEEMETEYYDRGMRPENKLGRRIGSGEWREFTLADLAPGVDTNGYFVEGVQAGPYGIVVWATRWDEGSNGNDGPPASDSLVLFSTDGISWGTTEVAGFSINGAIVGENDIMLAPYDPQIEFQMYEEGKKAIDLPPVPIVLARVDG